MCYKSMPLPASEYTNGQLKKMVDRYKFSGYADATDISVLTGFQSTDYLEQEVYKMTDSCNCKENLTATNELMSCCKVEAILSVDERGQMVLPKELREKIGLRAGDKLAAISMEKDGEVCCITLISVEKLMGVVKGFLGPVMKDLF